MPTFPKSENHTYIRGANLYGGLLDRCTINPFSPLNYDDNLPQYINGIILFTTITNIVNLDSISSDPVRVCFCNDMHQTDCSYQPPLIKVKKCEPFNISIAAVDQVERPLRAMIHTLLKANESGLGEGQLFQSTFDNCTDLLFNLYSEHDHEELIMYAEGPCKDAHLSQANLSVKFLPCSYLSSWFPASRLGNNDVCVCVCYRA